MKKLYGTTVPIITPFDEEGKVDVESLKKLTDHVIANGLSCLYPNGTTGEMLLLSVEERKLVSETVVRQAAGRVPVFVHAGAMNLADTVELAKHAVEIGADGIGVVTPSYLSFLIVRWQITISRWRTVYLRISPCTCMRSLKTR